MFPVYTLQRNYNGLIPKSRRFNNKGNVRNDQNSNI